MRLGRSYWLGASEDESGDEAWLSGAEGRFRRRADVVGGVADVLAPGVVERERRKRSGTLEGDGGVTTAASAAGDSGSERRSAAGAGGRPAMPLLAGGGQFLRV